MRKYKAVFFDLDGTLLDTVQDLQISINHALKNNDLPTDFSLNEVKYFLGNGVDVLVAKATNYCDDLKKRDKVKADFREHYKKQKYKYTKPYPGICNLLDKLKSERIFLGVLSNKPNFETMEIIEKFFPKTFSIVQGGVENKPLKPNPIIMNEFIEKNNFSTNEILYVGDTEVDTQFSINAKIDCAIVTWGFRKKEEVGKPKFIIDNIVDLYDILNINYNS